MTLGQAKSAAMMLIDQYTPDSPPTDDEETLSKLNCLVELAQVQLCQIKKKERRCVLLESQGTVDPETGMLTFALPKDFYQLRRVTMADTGQEAWAEIYGDTLETQAGHGTMILQYYAYPPEITDDTPDDTALELDRDTAQVLPYTVAADLLKADPSADYASFEAKYMGLLANLDPRMSAGRLVISTPEQRGI